MDKAWVLVMSISGSYSSDNVFSTVNLIALSMEFMCFGKFSLYSISFVTKVSPTYHFQSLGRFSAVV